MPLCQWEVCTVSGNSLNNDVCCMARIALLPLSSLFVCVASIPFMGFKQWAGKGVFFVLVEAKENPKW